jgi:hypothetical protein
MAAHGLLGVVGVARENGLEDCFMPGVVHLVDAGTPLHRAPMLGQPLHIGLVNRRIDRVTRHPIEHRMKGGVGLVEQGGITDRFAVGVERSTEFFEVVAPCMLGGPAGERGLHEDPGLEQVPDPFAVDHEMTNKIADSIDGDLVIGLSHDRAVPQAGFDEAAIGERYDRFTNSGPAHPVTLHQVTLRRKALTLLKSTRLNHGRQFGSHRIRPARACSHHPVAMQLFALVHGHLVRVTQFLAQDPAQVKADLPASNK